MVGKNRILAYDFLRGMAIILMVVGHSILVYPINLHKIIWCDLLYQWIYTFHMPLLFFVSGCVFNYCDLKSYFSKKINRILVPYVFFGIISNLFHSYGAILVHRHSDLSHLPTSLAFGYANWFLFTILLIFFTYPFIDRLIINKKIQLIIALIIMIFVPFSSFPGIFQLNNYIHYLPFFMMGCCIKSFFTMRQPRKYLLTIAMLCLVLHTSIFYFTYGIESDSLFSMKNLMAMLMIICFSCLFLDYEQHVLRDNQLGITSSFVQKCSIFSLQIYIFNGYWLVLGRTFLCNYCHITSPIVLIIVLSTFNLTMTYLICTYILPNSDWLNWICGNGKPNKNLKSSDS